MTFWRVIEQHKLTDKNIERCKITWNYYFPISVDNDNYISKFLSDALVSWIAYDDNYTETQPYYKYFMIRESEQK